MHDCSVYHPVDALWTPARLVLVEAGCRVEAQPTRRAVHLLVKPIRHVHLAAIVRREAPRQLIMREAPVDKGGEEREDVRWRLAPSGRVRDSRDPGEVAVAVALPRSQVPDGDLRAVAARDAVTVHQQPKPARAALCVEQLVVLQVRRFHAGPRAVSEQAALALLEDLLRSCTVAKVEVEAVGRPVVQRPQVPHFER